MRKTDKKIVIVAKSAKAVIEALKARGIEALTVASNPSLPVGIADHADLNCLLLPNGAIAVLEEQERLIFTLKAEGYEAIPIKGASREYPADCVLNCLLANGVCVSHKTALNDEIRRLLVDGGVRLLDSKQGYSRCSAALVNERAAITADSTINGLLSGQGIEVLLVPQGEIALHGYDYGFIGGSCFLISKNELAFFGQASKLSYYEIIEAFCAKNGVTVIELTDEPLRDIGGAVALYSV